MLSLFEKFDKGYDLEDFKRNYKIIDLWSYDNNITTTVRMKVATSLAQSVKKKFFDQMAFISMLKQDGIEEEFGASFIETMF